MNTLAYYLGYLLLPVLFLMNLCGNLYSAIKHSYNNAKVQTYSDMQSHRRYYKRG